jgi:hypothetical protein
VRPRVVASPDVYVPKIAKTPALRLEDRSIGIALQYRRFSSRQ